MSPSPRDPPVTRATLPSMEKRFDIGGTMPRPRAEGKARRSPPAAAALDAARVLRYKPAGERERLGAGGSVHGGGWEDRPERALFLREREEVQALLPRAGRSARAAS